LAGLLVALLASPAMAQTKSPTPTDTLNGRPLTDAPVSSIGPGRVAPSDRVGGPGLRSDDAGPVGGTPFSAAPAGTLGGGGGDVGGRQGNAESRDGGTPNLGR